MMRGALGVGLAMALTLGSVPPASAQLWQEDTQTLLRSTLEGLDLPFAALLTNRRQADTLSGAYLGARHAQSVNDWRSARDLFDQVYDSVQAPFIARELFLLNIGVGDVTRAEALIEAVQDVSYGFELQRIVRFVIAAREDTPSEALSVLNQEPVRDQYIRPLLALWAADARDRLQDAPPCAEGVDCPTLQQAIATAEQVAFDDGETLGDLIYGLHLALVNARNGNVERAEQLFRQTVDLAAPLRVVQFYAAFLVQQGRADEALALYEDRFGSRTSGVEVSIDLERIRAGEPPRALPETLADGAAEALFDIASVLDSDPSLDQVVLFGQFALSLNPQHDLALLLVGDAQVVRGQLLEAAEVLGRVPAESPLYWTASLRRIDSLLQAGEREAGEALLRQMADLRPERTEALERLAGLAREDLDWPASEAFYTQIIARAEAAEEPDWRHYFGRAVTRERQDNWPAAEADLLTALELEPEQPLVLNYLGYTWADRGEHLDEAMEMIERAVAQRPNDGYLVDSLGWVHYRMGNYDAALVELERAAMLEPEDPEITDHYGDILWHFGRRREARFQWHRARFFATLQDDADHYAELIEGIETKLEHGLPETDLADNAE